MNKWVMKSLVLISHLGISMVVPIALCMFIGMFIAEQLSAPIITVLFFIIGALAGFRNAYILCKDAYMDNNKKGTSDNEKHE